MTKTYHDKQAINADVQRFVWTDGSNGYCLLHINKPTCSKRIKLSHDKEYTMLATQQFI